MKTIRFSEKVYEKIHYLKRGDKRLFDLIEVKLNLLILNESHPSLRRHKLSGKMYDYWSISINRSIRMIYMIVKDEYYFIDIGKHEKVYK